MCVCVKICVVVWQSLPPSLNPFSPFLFSEISIFHSLSLVLVIKFCNLVQCVCMPLVESHCVCKPHTHYKDSLTTHLNWMGHVYSQTYTYAYGPVHFTSSFLSMIRTSVYRSVFHRLGISPSLLQSCSRSSHAPCFLSVYPGYPEGIGCSTTC